MAPFRNSKTRESLYLLQKNKILKILNKKSKTIGCRWRSMDLTAANQNR